jgi:hypothetical protein
LNRKRRIEDAQEFKNAQRSARARAPTDRILTTTNFHEDEAKYSSDLSAIYNH